MAKPYPKVDQKGTFVAHLLTFCLLIAVIALISNCDATILEEEELNDFHTNPFHVGWRKKNTRFDFVFKLNGTIKKNSRPNSQYEANLTAECAGHSACLYQDGKLLRIYQANKNYTASNNLKFAFNIERSIVPENCTTSQVLVFTHCSTHWSPPIHTFGGDCDHSIEWHSPISCPSESKNHQRPCYAHDDSGNLVDLTRLIKSDGSSYKISNGNHTLVKDFHFNVCNEASESCGPNVSSCYTGPNGLIEIGYNNLTSLSHKNKTFVITSFGEFKKNCTHDRVKTVINLSCPKKATTKMEPSLVQSNDCENIVEWNTVEACPLPDIQVPATTCAIQNNELGINIDLKRLTNNQTTVKVPRFKLNGVNYTMMLGLCRGISSTSLKCENKATSTTSACLVEDSVASAGNTTKTNITGSITRSFIRLADNRIYLESMAPNKSCKVSNNNNLTVSKPVVTRIEFYCSPTANTTVPNFLAYEDCTYILEWPSSSLCNLLGSFPNQQTNGTQASETIKPPTSIVNSTSSTQKPSISDFNTTPDLKSKAGSERHRDTFNEAKLIGANTKKVEESSLPDHTGIETTIPVYKPPLEAHSFQPESKPTSRGDRMNNVEKFFMVGLIVMSMCAFIVVIFLLDKRTRDGTPIDRILQPWKIKPSLFVEDNVRGRRRRRDDDGGTIGLIEAEDP